MKTIELKKERDNLLKIRNSKMDKIEQLNDQLDIVESDLRYVMGKIKLEKEEQ